MPRVFLRRWMERFLSDVCRELDVFKRELNLHTRRIAETHARTHTAVFLSAECSYMPTDKAKFHRTDTNTDTDFLADFRARILARKSACPAHAAAGRSAALAARSARRLVRGLLSGRALFLARMSFGDARVYTCTCTVHDKLSCTRLQNYRIGASLTDKSVLVLLLWNLTILLC